MTSKKISNKQQRSAIKLGSHQERDQNQQEISIRENIIKSTLKYVQFWTMISRQKPDLKRLDELNEEIRSNFDNLLQSWNYCQERGTILSRGTLVLLVKYFVEVSNERSIGFGILQVHPDIAKLADFQEYDLDNMHIKGAETKESFRDQFEKVFKNNFSRTIKTMKIAIVLILMILSLFNYFDFDYSMKNLDQAQNVAEMLVQTNKLHTQMQNIASYVIDAHANTQKAITIFDIKYMNHDQLLTSLQSSCQQIDPIVASLRRINQSIANQLIFSVPIYLEGPQRNDINSTSLASNLGGSQGTDGILPINFGNQTDLLKATNMLTNQAQLLSRKKSDQNNFSIQEQENFIIENSLNAHYNAVMEAYWRVKQLFTEENHSAREMFMLTYILSGIFLFSTAFVLVSILIRGMSKREKVYAWLFRIPFNKLQVMITRCLNLLKKSGVEDSILDQIRTVINEENKGLIIDNNAVVGNAKSLDASADNLQSNEETIPELIRQQPGFFNTGKIQRVFCLLIVFLFLHSYYLVNFTVQNYLIDDLEVFVDMENLDVLDQSFYLVNSNAIQLFLLDRNEKVAGKSSYTFVEYNIPALKLVAYDIDFIKQRISFQNFLEQFSSVFEQSEFCSRQKLFEEEECISSLKAMGTQIDFISVSQKFTSHLDSLINNVDQDLAINQMTLLSIFKLDQYKEMTTLQRFYIHNYLQQQQSQLKDIVIGNISLMKQLRILQYFIYLLIQVFLICFLWFPVINRTNQDIQRARSFLNLIPVYSI